MSNSSRFALAAALLAFAAMLVPEPAEAGRRTGTWRYYNPRADYGYPYGYGYRRPPRRPVYGYGRYRGRPYGYGPRGRYYGPPRGYPNVQIVPSY